MMGVLNGVVMEISVSIDHLSKQYIHIDVFFNKIVIKGFFICRVRNYMMGKEVVHNCCSNFIDYQTRIKGRGHFSGLIP